MIGDGNPFVYSRPVAPEDLMDRDEEVAQLLRLAVGGHFVRVYAPRKFGKTSLLGRLLRDGEREGLVPVLVDLYGVLSIADVTVRVERAYAAQLKGSLRARIDAFLKSTGLGLSLGAFGVSANLHLQPKTDPLPALHALLDLPLRLEAGGGYRALVVFDEFQDVGKVPSLDAILRSHVQHQGDVASYVFSGSEPGMMRQLFERKDRPLYGSAVPMRLERLRDADIAGYVIDRFTASGRRVGDALGPLLRTAQGHPQRAIHLAHRLWNEVGEGETAAYDDWERAYHAALLELHPEFDAHWRALATSEQRALRAVIAGQGSPFKGDVLRRLGFEKATAHSAVQRLIASAEVEVVDRRHVVVDPLFADWIAALPLAAAPGAFEPPAV
jgi:hypothetical protein